MSEINIASCLFSRTIPTVGSFSVQAFNIDQHITDIHCWVKQDYAKFWGMSTMNLQQVKDEYERILNDATVYAGYFNNRFSFIIECYDPRYDPVGLHYKVQEGDQGMHILVAPPERPLANFTWNVFTTVMEFMFHHLHAERVVVEPDIRNEKIHVLNKRAGFIYQKQIELAEKTAHLAFCTQQQYANAISLQQN